MKIWVVEEFDEQRRRWVLSTVHQTRQDARTQAASNRTYDDHEYRVKAYVRARPEEGQ